MAFDTDTRKKLARMVANARDILRAEFTSQLQEIYGIQPDGNIADIEKLSHLDDEQRDIARLLRARVFHLASSMGNEKKPIQAAIDRMTREQSFTLLNRFAALRMCEERKFIQQCVGAGMDSEGFAVYLQVAGTGLGSRYDRYCNFIFCVFDEIAIDLSVLFDRFSPYGLLFPRESALEKLLDVINQPELKNIWTEDEAIGWIYQYFNPSEERKAMRDASQAPRNSRELAVRNQFFTPRYVVEFLTDNTLGRIWYEMCEGNTALKKVCRYLVRRPNEIYLAQGDKIPATEESENDLSQEELLKRPVYIPHRPVKDPRNLKMLDPACGSMHFGLYAFDLFEIIYREAWEMEEQLGAHALIRSKDLKSLHETYEDKNAFLTDVPSLIIEHNIHGIDIDPRAVQIAALALWLRAQKSWKNLGVKAAERPRISRSNIVTAEPMPGDEDMRREFTTGIKPRVLGQIVDVVFDKMKLAGEAGSLLKIEEEIKDAVEKARKQWVAGPKPEQQILFPDMAQVRPKQQELLFDVKGITDERFWEQAEDRILEALKEYSEQAENGRAVRRRLFAEDAARGFAFIDLCRKRYDVVLMNPPFGGFSRLWNAQAKITYPNSSNDILAAFVDRFLRLLNPGGWLGAITSRTCFFLSTFKDWRLNVVLKGSAIRSIADLGQGVMDNAMVEATAYVLEKTRPASRTTVFRAIADTDRQAALEACIDAHNHARPENRLFLADQADFHLLPDSPFVYWIGGQIIKQFQTGKKFEPDVGNVRVGLQTGDDPRYVRAVWEVPHENTIFCYYPANGEGFCRLDDPIVQSYFRRRNKGTPHWAFHVKSGASQPWYSPVTLKVNWAQDGKELKNFKNEKDKLRSRPQNTIFYFRPGFSWTRRAVRLYPYVIPCNCIPSVSRYMAFPDYGLQVEAIGVCASRLISAFLRFYGEKFEFPNFLVDTLKMTPWPELPAEAKAQLEALIAREVEKRRVAYQNHEPFQEFLLPVKVKDFSDSGRALAFDPAVLLDQTTESMVTESFGFSGEQAQMVERDLLEAIAYQRGGIITAGQDATEPEKGPDGEAEDDSADEDNSDFVLDYSPYAIEEAHISYLISCIFGRWDVRIALDPSLAPKLPHPFDPLPACPPGMLVGQDGLPSEPNRIVSKEWLRARPDANTLPQEDRFKNPTVLGSEYPLRISWDGILVDDPGFEIGEPHRSDIVRRIREVLDLLWKDKAHEIEQEACEIINVSDLRNYFRKPTGFFQDHLKRYSKSRRKAPIYWPLSTESGSYSLWIYYHRLTDQTLFTCVNDYLKPKIEEVSRDMERLQKELKEAGNANKRSHLEKLQDLRQELIDLRDELQLVSKMPYKPNLNDGVMITAAPLWKLFRYKPWQKELKSCWEKLEAGEYDWAHMAYSIWPERVKKQCKTDRSIAIAHGLEHLCEVEIKETKKKKARKKKKGL